MTPAPMPTARPAAQPLAALIPAAVFALSGRPYPEVLYPEAEPATDLPAGPPVADRPIRPAPRRRRPLGAETAPAPTG